LLCQRALYLFCYYTKLSTKSSIFLHFFRLCFGWNVRKEISESAASFSVGKEECFFRQILRQFCFS
jgi:hypothetical protein